MRRSRDLLPPSDDAHPSNVLPSVSREFLLPGAVSLSGEEEEVGGLGSARCFSTSIMEDLSTYVLLFLPGLWGDIKLEANEYICNYELRAAAVYRRSPVGY